jgi:hypothetical protein
MPSAVDRVGRCKRKDGASPLLRRALAPRTWEEIHFTVAMSTTRLRDVRSTSKALNRELRTSAPRTVQDPPKT